MAIKKKGMKHVLCVHCLISKAPVKLAPCLFFTEILMWTCKEQEPGPLFCAI